MIFPLLLSLPINNNPIINFSLFISFFRRRTVTTRIGICWENFGCGGWCYQWINHSDPSKTNQFCGLYLDSWCPFSPLRCHQNCFPSRRGKRGCVSKPTMCPKICLKSMVFCFDYFCCFYGLLSKTKILFWNPTILHQ